MANRRGANGFNPPDEPGIESFIPGNEARYGGDELTDPEENALNSILMELQGSAEEASISVYRITNPQDKRAGQFLFRDDPISFNASGLERIRDEYGGGMYKVQVRNVGGSLMCNQCIEIAEPKYKKPAETTPANNPADFAAVMASIMEKQQQTMMAGFTALAQAIAPQKPAANTPDILDTLIKMKTAGLLGDNSPAKSAFDPSTVLELIRTGMDMASGVQKETREKTLIDVAAEYLPKIMEMTNMAGGGQHHAPQPAPQMLAHNQGGKPHVKILLAALLPAAMKNSDTELYVDFVFDQIGETEASMLTLADFVAVDPRVNQYSPWFVTLLAEIKEALMEQYGGEMPQQKTTEQTAQGGDSEMFKLFLQGIIGKITAKETPASIAAYIIKSTGEEQGRALADHADIIGLLSGYNADVAKYVPEFTEIHGEMKKLLTK